MSVVVGLVKDGHVYMAADTRALQDYEMSYCKKLITSTHKQFGLWAIGASGYVRNLEIAAELDLPTLTRAQKKTTTLHDVSRAFFDAVREEVESRGVLNGGNSETSFLLGVKGRLFSVDATFSLREEENLCAIGSGSDYAEGALWALLTYCPDMPPEQMVRAAVESAAHYNVSVGGNIDVAVI